MKKNREIIWHFIGANGTGKPFFPEPSYFPDTDTDTDVLEEEEVDAEALLSLENHIVIYNDDVNTFQFIEKTLQDVCGHTVEQSMQCSYLIHHKGRCSVKQGSYKKLKPLLEEILFRKITATIE